MTPPFFNNLTKSVNNILSDDYSLKRTLKVKHTTAPHKVGFTVEDEYKKGAISGKWTVKWAHPASGFSLDKVTMKADGTYAVESSITGLAPGLKLTSATDNDLKGVLGAEYTGANYASKASVDLAFSTVSASATFDVQGVNAGGSISYKLPGEKPPSVKDYNVGVSYGAKKWFGALSTADQMKTYKLSASYTPTKDVTGALVASATPEKNSQVVTAGVLFSCNPKTTMRAKVDSAGEIHGVVSQKCTSTMTVALTGAVNVKSMDPKFGIACTLG
ncbi:unnamed protein product [Chrysoparadoxa australica]